MQIMTLFRVGFSFLDRDAVSTCVSVLPYTCHVTVVEQKLFVMYLEHRMRTFPGTFHASPDYVMWYGWSEMRRDLTETRELAAEMRRNHITATGKSGEQPS